MALTGPEPSCPRHLPWTRLLRKLPGSMTVTALAPRREGDRGVAGNLGWPCPWMGPSLLWASACLLSCKAGPRTCVYVTGGRGSKHVPVRGQAGPGLALSKFTEGREHRPPPNAQGRGVSVVRTHRPGATSTGASRVSRQMSSAP